MPFLLLMPLLLLLLWAVFFTPFPFLDVDDSRHELLLWVRCPEVRVVVHKIKAAGRCMKVCGRWHTTHCRRRR